MPNANVAKLESLIRELTTKGGIAFHNKKKTIKNYYNTLSLNDKRKFVNEHPGNAPLLQMIVGKNDTVFYKTVPYKVPPEPSAPIMTMGGKSRRQRKSRKASRRRLTRRRR